MIGLAEDRFVGIEATQALIAKVKKGDAENASAISRVEEELLRIAPPSAAGAGEVIMYRGTLE